MTVTANGSMIYRGEQADNLTPGQVDGNFKLLENRVGNLAGLTTSTKLDLVSSINEVKAGIAGALPAQSGNGGKLLGTDGANAAWVTPAKELPSPAGTPGILRTDGTNPAWATNAVMGYSNQLGFINLEDYIPAGEAPGAQNPQQLLLIMRAALLDCANTGKGLRFGQSQGTSTPGYWELWNPTYWNGAETLNGNNSASVTVPLSYFCPYSTNQASGQKVEVYLNGSTTPIASTTYTATSNANFTRLTITKNSGVFASTDSVKVNVWWAGTQGTQAGPALPITQNNFWLQGLGRKVSRIKFRDYGAPTYCGCLSDVSTNRDGGAVSTYTIEYMFGLSVSVPSVREHIYRDASLWGDWGDIYPRGIGAWQWSFDSGFTTVTSNPTASAPDWEYLGASTFNVVDHDPDRLCYKPLPGESNPYYWGDSNSFQYTDTQGNIALAAYPPSSVDPAVYKLSTTSGDPLVTSVWGFQALSTTPNKDGSWFDSIPWSGDPSNPVAKDQVGTDGSTLLSLFNGGIGATLEISRFGFYRARGKAMYSGRYEFIRAQDNEVCHIRRGGLVFSGQVRQAIITGNFFEEVQDDSLNVAAGYASPVVPEHAFVVTNNICLNSSELLIGCVQRAIVANNIIIRPNNVGMGVHSQGYPSGKYSKNQNEVEQALVQVRNNLVIDPFNMVNILPWGGGDCAGIRIGGGGNSDSYPYPLTRFAYADGNTSKFTVNVWVNPYDPTEALQVVRWVASTQTFDAQVCVPPGVGVVASLTNPVFTANASQDTNPGGVVDFGSNVPANDVLFFKDKVGGAYFGEANKSGGVLPVTMPLSMVNTMYGSKTTSRMSAAQGALFMDVSDNQVFMTLRPQLRHGATGALVANGPNDVSKWGYKYAYETYTQMLGGQFLPDFSGVNGVPSVNYLTWVKSVTGTDVPILPGSAWNFVPNSVANTIKSTGVMSRWAHGLPGRIHVRGPVGGVDASGNWTDYFQLTPAVLGRDMVFWRQNAANTFGWGPHYPSGGISIKTGGKYCRVANNMVSGFMFGIHLSTFCKSSADISSSLTDQFADHSTWDYVDVSGNMITHCTAAGILIEGSGRVRIDNNNLIGDPDFEAAYRPIPPLSTTSPYYEPMQCRTATSLAASTYTVNGYSYINTVYDGTWAHYNDHAAICTYGTVSLEITRNTFRHWGTPYCLPAPAGVITGAGGFASPLPIESHLWDGNTFIGNFAGWGYNSGNIGLGYLPQCDANANIIMAQDSPTDVTGDGASNQVLFGQVLNACQKATSNNRPPLSGKYLPGWVVKNNAPTLPASGSSFATGWIKRADSANGWDNTYATGWGELQTVYTVDPSKDAAWTVSAPSPFTAAVYSATWIKLSFNVQSNAAGYVLVWGVSGGSTATINFKDTATPGYYIKKSLTVGTAYSFTLKAKDSAGTLYPSSTITITAGPPVSAPSASASGGTQIDVSWTDTNNNESAFTVRRYVSGTLETSFTNITASPFTDPSAVPGVAYTYTVAAANAAGEGPESTATSGVTMSVAVPNADYAFDFGQATQVLADPYGKFAFPNPRVVVALSDSGASAFAMSGTRLDKLISTDTLKGTAGLLTASTGTIAISGVLFAGGNASSYLFKVGTSGSGTGGVYVSLSTSHPASTDGTTGSVASSLTITPCSTSPAPSSSTYDLAAATTPGTPFRLMYAWDAVNGKRYMMLSTFNRATNAWSTPVTNTATVSTVAMSQSATLNIGPGSELIVGKVATWNNLALTTAQMAGWNGW